MRICRGEHPATEDILRQGRNDMGTILLYIVAGLVIGAVARLLMPGRDPMGLLATIALGIVGAVVGGLIGEAVSPDGTIHWILAVVVAMALLFIYRAVSGRGRRTMV
jgi:uncharacterized membrane protein YeaQ/YmgE (transglycosylase-associated protein family)